jgi:hypothetical protein
VVFGWGVWTSEGSPRLGPDMDYRSNRSSAPM